LGIAVAPKRLELLHELLPTVRVMALLVDPTDPTNAKTTVSEVSAAAHTFGLQLHVLNVSSESDLVGVFAKLIQLGAGGLVVGGGSFFVGHQEQLAALTVRHAVPTASEHREFAVSGGLLSYGASLSEAYRLAGVYAARVLKGEKPGDLPVQQATKVELFLNLKSAKALGISVPFPLSGRADELIE
jgi:putative ABC transport system substrate-binding protein